MIRYLTAGESHGQCLVGILEGIPAGLPLTVDEIDKDLRRRQMGYGRGDRMKIEQDHVQILTGVRYGETLGSPIALRIENRDWKNWTEQMSVEPMEKSVRTEPLTSPRPGHADFAGAIKYHHKDIRNVIERSSARETAMRVAIGAICRFFLRQFGIEVGSHVVQIGSESAYDIALPKNAEEINRKADTNPLRCLDESASRKMMKVIDQAKEKGDTIGGAFEVVVTGMPVGIGSYVHADRRLDGILAGALLSIPAIKAAGIGMGEDVAKYPGSEVHDRIFPATGDIGIKRKTNNAGGIEGGMTNGEPVRVRAVMKPLASLAQPLDSVNMATGEPVMALRERSDVCAVVAAAVVAEAVVMLALMNPFLEKFGGDSLEEIRAHIQATPPLPWK